jgi:hypothetical protein
MAAKILYIINKKERLTTTVVINNPLLHSAPGEAVVLILLIRIKLRVFKMQERKAII